MKQYDNRFVVAVLICLKEIIFHISSYLNFCVCNYTNFLFSTVGRNIAANVLRLYAVRDCGLLSCQPTLQFERDRMFDLPLSPLLHIALLLPAAFFYSCENRLSLFAYIIFTLSSVASLLLS